MRTKLTANAVVSEDTDGLNVLFGPSAAGAEKTLDGFQRVTSGVTDLVDAEVLSLPYGDVDDAKGLFLVVTNGDLDVVINGGSTLQLRRGTVASGTLADDARILLDVETTSLQVTAVGACRVTWCLWGNPVA